MLLVSPTEYKPVKLVEKTQVNYNTQIYTFELPANEYLNMPLGKHLTIRYYSTPIIYSLDSYS